MKFLTLSEVREYAHENLNLLWDEYKRSLNPEEYPVDLSQKCWDNKMRNIQEVKEMEHNFIEQNGGNVLMSLNNKKLLQH